MAGGLVKVKLDTVLSRCDSLFLLDFSWFLYREYYALHNLGVNINGYFRPTGHIHGIMNTIISIKSRYPKSCIILCKDGVPIERNELASTNNIGYKVGRAELEFDFYKDQPIIEAFAYYLPDVYVSYNSDKESDDLMYCIAKQSKSLFNGSIFVYSGDNDLLQTIDDRISIIRKWSKYGDLPIINRDTLVTDNKLLKKFGGCCPENLPIYRAIVGDSSDKIPSVVKRFNRQVAVRIAKESKSYDDVFKFKPCSKIEEKWYQYLLENKDRFDVNYKLMKLNTNFEPNVYDANISLSKISKVLKDLHLYSVIKYLQGV